MASEIPISDMPSAKPTGPPPLPIEQPRSETPKPTRHELFVDARLAATRRHVMGVDLSAGFLTLAIGSLIYLFLCALLDQWVVSDGLGHTMRWFLLLGLLAGAGYYVYRAIVPPILYRISPVFAAHTIEQSKKTLKNSLVNYLAMRRHREDVSRSVLDAMKTRAAHDLSKVELEVAVDRTHVFRLGYALVGVLAVCLIYLVISPKNPFISAMRVVFPWTNIAVPSRVEIEDVTPGSIDVFRGDSLLISARIEGLSDGEIPELHYTTTDRREVDQVIPLTAEAGRWQCRFLEDSGGIRQHTDYYITAGDARSMTFRLTARVAPTIEVEKLKYDFPSYTNRPSRTVENTGDIRAVEGTAVTIYVVSNVPIERAEIDLDCNGSRLPMTISGKDRKHAQRQIKIGFDPNHPNRPRDNCYQLHLADTRGNTNRTTVRHRIEVIRDRSPVVEILEPSGEEVNVPIDGQVIIRVRAEDPDYGLRKVALRALRGQADLPIAPFLNLKPEEKAGEDLFERTYRFVPKSFGLKVGERIPYRAECADSKLPEPNLHATETRYLRISAAVGGDAMRESQGARSDSPQDPNEPESPQEDSNNQTDPQNEESGQENGPSEDGTPGDSQPSEGSQQEQGDSSSEAGQDDEAESESGSQGGSQGGSSQSDSSSQDEESQSGENASEEGGMSGGSSGDGQGESSENSSSEGQSKAGQGGGSNQNEEAGSNGQGSSSNESSGNDAPGSAGEGSDPAGDSGGNQTSGQPSDQGSGSEGMGGGESASTPGGESGQGGQGEQPKNYEPVDSAAQDGDAFERILEHMQEKNGDAQGDTSGQDASQEEPAGGSQDAGQNQGSQGGNQEDGQESSGSQGESGSESQQAGSDGQEQDGSGSQGGEQEKPAGGDSQESSQGAGADQQNQKPQGGSQESQESSGGGSEQKPQQSSGSESGQSQGGGSQQEKPNQSESQGSGSQSSGEQQGQKSQSGEQGNATHKEQQGSQAQGETSGDRSGDGEEGGGQDSNRAGQGTAGSHTPGDTGGEPGGEQGGDATGSKAGTDTMAEKPTGQSDPQQRQGEGSQSRPQGNQGDQQGQPSGDPSQSNDPSQNNNQQEPGEQGEGQRPSENESPSGGSQGPGAPQGGGRAGGSSGSAPMGGHRGADQANRDYADQQSSLALEHLADQLRQGDNELLSRLGWTPDEAQQFVARWRQLRETGAAPTASVAQQEELSEALKSLGLRPRRMQTNVRGTSDRVQGQREGSRFIPPPEWEDFIHAYRKGVARGGR